MSEERFDTIVAPATPSGRSALALVRIDGPSALPIVLELSSRPRLSPRRATLVTIRAGDGVIDQGVATWFAAPASYTGNDLVELSVHGSTWIVEALVRACVEAGARLAEPGEFTERAVLNGRIDLTQAEGVVELIGARTSLQARLALSHLEGVLSRAGDELREKLLFVISRLEGALDFADEGYEFISRSDAEELLDGALGEIRLMLSTFSRGRAVAEGLTLVILGRPNAGKSTLLNALVGSDRAIVTDIPGTTRDLIREGIELAGVPVTVVDTAGIRETEDVVEVQGIDRARLAAARADLVLYLIDGSRGLTPEDEREISALSRPVLVWSKADLSAPGGGAVPVRAREHGGIELLLAELEGRIREEWVPEVGSPTLANERQRVALEGAAESLDGALTSLRNGLSEEVVLVDLYRSASSLSLLVGGIGVDEVMGEIFSKFCIGK